jgi:2-(3-amino-3-carboxypropyl)histidine synthase
MKFMFIETKYAGRIKVPEKVIGKLPQKVGLFFTIQFIDSLEDVKKDIESTGRTVRLMKGKHTRYPGQIYGCNLERFKGVDAFLYVGDGLFHPKALVLANSQPVHVWNPVAEKYSLLDKSLMEQEIRRQKAAYAKFLHSTKIGVLISTKPGQSYFSHALKLKEKYTDKEFYFVAFDTISFEGLEDFPFVEVWVNTACPRIGWDDTKRANKPMVDLGSVI